MKRLFALKFPAGRLLTKQEDGSPCYFADKKSAKEVRDAMNNGLTVTYGPDHDGKTASQHRRSRKRKLRGSR